ncbi:MAG TPA: hypothetical protein ENI95_00445 [Chloroflexi bacterium]|nr:hypothetical protein [Chloroflexota bacterium]
MGVIARWDNGDRKTLLIEFSDPWTWNDYHAMIARATEMVNQVIHTVDVIADLRNSSTVPDSDVIRNLVGGLNQMPYNVGLYVIVGLDGFEKSIATVFEKAMNSAAVVRSLDEARAYLARWRVW